MHRWLARVGLTENFAVLIHVKGRNLKMFFQWKERMENTGIFQSIDVLCFIFKCKNFNYKLIFPSSQKSVMVVFFLPIKQKYMIDWATMSKYCLLTLCELFPGHFPEGYSRIPPEQRFRTVCKKEQHKGKVYSLLS